PMAEYLLLALIFLFFAGVTGMAYLAVAERRKRVEARLLTTPSSDPLMGSQPELILGELTPALSGQIPMSAEARSDLQRDLLGAGLYRPTALMEYTAIRAVMTITP